MNLILIFELCKILKGYNEKWDDAKKQDFLLLLFTKLVEYNLQR